MSDMFCFQCQETVQNKGCTRVGVCGKSSEVANLQDLLIFTLKGISICSTLLREKANIEKDEVNRFVIDSLFMTITNGNFNRYDFYNKIKEALKLRNDLLLNLNENGLQPEFPDSDYLMAMNAAEQMLSGLT